MPISVCWNCETPHLQCTTWRRAGVSTPNCRKARWWVAWWTQQLLSYWMRLMVFTGRMTEAERGIHLEGDTPTHSDISDDTIDEDDTDSEFDGVVSAVFERRTYEGRLEYLVSFVGDIDVIWVDRSDLWDFADNTQRLKEYDAAHPIEWDAECQFCGAPFQSTQRGCEECRCDECPRVCRHLSGVNYGCPYHPVI